MVSNPSMTFQRTLTVLIVLLLYAPTGNTAAAQAADFGFRFEVSGCVPERFDTSNGVFTENLGGEYAGGQIVTAHISLTDAQMSAIYRTIENIRFLADPSTFGGVPAEVLDSLRATGTAMMAIPSHTYRLEVRNGGAVHTVSWESGHPTTAEADRLRDLFTMILGFIHETPEFKRLPVPMGGCEENGRPNACADRRSGEPRA